MRVDLDFWGPPPGASPAQKVVFEASIFRCVDTPVFFEVLGGPNDAPGGRKEALGDRKEALGARNEALGDRNEALEARNETLMVLGHFWELLTLTLRAFVFILNLLRLNLG